MAEGEATVGGVVVAVLRPVGAGEVAGHGSGPAEAAPTAGVRGRLGLDRELRRMALLHRREATRRQRERRRRAGSVALARG